MLHGLTRHETFHRHPLMPRLLREQADRGPGYIELADRLFAHDREAMTAMKENA